MDKRMFAEVVEYRNGCEFIIEVDTDQLPRILHLLISSIHTELICFDFLVIQMSEDIVIGHYFNEVVLTPLVM